MADIDYFEDIQWLQQDLDPIDSSLFVATDSLSQFDMNPSDIPPQERFMELPTEIENDFTLAPLAELNTGARDSPLAEGALEDDNLPTAGQLSQAAKNPVAKRLSLPIKFADVEVPVMTRNLDWSLPIRMEERGFQDVPIAGNGVKRYQTLYHPAEK